MSEFTESLVKDKPCPKCNAVVIFMHGGGWDNDMEYCSTRDCDYDVKYETSSYIDDED